MTSDFLLFFPSFHFFLFQFCLCWFVLLKVMNLKLLSLIIFHTSLISISPSFCLFTILFNVRTIIRYYLRNTFKSYFLMGWRRRRRRIRRRRGRERGGAKEEEEDFHQFYQFLVEPNFLLDLTVLWDNSNRMLGLFPRFEFENTCRVMFKEG